MRRMFDHYLREVDPGGTILEIGPGRGEFADLALERGHPYVGLEPSADLYRKLRERGIDVRCATVPPIPVEDESVDLVYSLDVFEHFQSYREAMEVCLEAYRVLRPGGHLLIIAPNAETLGPIFYMYEYQHAFVTNKGRLEGLIRDAGFELRSSGAFLTNLGLSALWPLDRVLAHLLLPIARSGSVLGLLRAIGLEDLVFRGHKVLCDHIGVLARKPANDRIPRPTVDQEAEAPT